MSSFSARLAAIQPLRAEGGMALGHGVSDDLVTPSVALDDGLDQADALVFAGTIGVGEERESRERAVGACRRVALVAEWHPEPSRASEIPGGGARTCQVEVDQGDGTVVFEDDVVEVWVVMRNESLSEPLGDWMRPVEPARIEARYGIVIAA